MDEHNSDSWFIVVTARDYDMDRDEVAKVYKQSESYKEFFEQLEAILVQNRK